MVQTVVPAYNSLDSLNEESPVANASDHVEAQAYLLSRRLAIPDLPEDVIVRECVNLSSDADFRAKRSDLFDWQSLALARDWSPEEAVYRICEMTDRYNESVKNACKTVHWRMAFTLCGIGIGFATGGPIGAGAAAALSCFRLIVRDQITDY